MTQCEKELDERMAKRQTVFTHQFYVGGEYGEIGVYEFKTDSQTKANLKMTKVLAEELYGEWEEVKYLGVKEEA
jgi:hypothetical protein